MQNMLSEILSNLDLELFPLKKVTNIDLMNRVDKKFWFHTSELAELLETIKNDYFIQSVDGRKFQDYATEYFDTSDDRMYTLHHNGKLNRYKIRRRDYLDSNDHFLEVKLKNNQGRTIKKRVKSTVKETQFNEEEKEFLKKRSVYGDEELRVALKNRFTRLTLIAKDHPERVTIDTDIRFISSDKTISMGDLVVLEIKSERGDHHSPLKQYLRDKRIKPAGFSKYCIGRALTDRSLKRNRFKQRIREIGKMTGQTDLYNM